MADLASLQAQRAQIIAEIQKRGGRAKAPGYQKQLEAVEAQIRAARGPANTTPPAGSVNNGQTSANIPATVPDNITTTSQGVGADIGIQNSQAAANIGLNNPNTITPFGSSTFDPKTNTFSQTLAPGQQAISDADDKITQMSKDLVQQKLGDQAYTGTFNPTTRPSFGTGDLAADKTKVEDSIFQSLTRDTARNKAKEQEELDQYMANRGIPRDPNDPQYQEAVRQFNQRYDDIYANAKSQAIQQGTQEYATLFGIGETGKANDVSQSLAIQGQNDQKLSQLQGLGTGLKVPSLPGFQGASVQYSNPTDVYLALQQGKISLKQANAAIDALKKQTGGGSGGGASSGSTPTAPDDSGAFY